MRPPHRFPFEFVDRVDSNGPRALVASNSWWLRGDGPLTLPWLVEAAAQAAARVLDPRPSEGGRLALAAIDQASLDRPVVAGETIDLQMRLVGRFRDLIRVEGVVRSGGEEIGRLALTLVTASAELTGDGTTADGG